MRSKNIPTDVFKHINMNGGDVTRCWEWTASVPSNGRPQFQVDGRRILAYRLVYSLYTGEELDRSVVIRHKCDNPLCCNPHHLETGSHQDNMDDMKQRERHGLPHHVVRAVRRLRADGVPQKDVAKRFGVSRETISGIDTGRYYSHVVNEDGNENGERNEGTC